MPHTPYTIGDFFYFNGAPVGSQQKVVVQNEVGSTAPLRLNSPGGANAGVLRDDTNKAVIIVYMGAATDAQVGDGALMATGMNPDSLQGFKDSLAFAQQVATEAREAEYGNIYVTGLSLGAAQASYVSMKLGLPGVGFAGAGLGGHRKTGAEGLDANFISVVAFGDFYGQVGTDTSCPPPLARVGVPMDHVGELVQIGDPSQNGALIQAWSGLNVFNLLFDTVDQRASAEQAMASIMARIHNIPYYLNALGSTLSVKV